MLSVDPILERIFFRSGADTLVGGRGGLGTGLVLGATLTVEAFLESTDVLPGPESLGAAGLGRLPGRAGEEVVGVVALLLAVEEVEVLFRQPGSAEKQRGQEDQQGKGQKRQPGMLLGIQMGLWKAEHGVGYLMKILQWFSWHQ